MASVLVLDDSIELLEMFEILFKMKGVAVRTSSNLVNFNDKILEQKPDLIILDIMLGADDGRLICKDLKTRSETSDIPVIITSASNSKLDDYRNYLADDILEKPFTKKELFDKVDNLLTT